MAIRVPTPVTQGAQNLGGAQAQAAATPYQRLTLPDTSFNSRMLQQIGQSGVQFANYLQEQEDERVLLEFQSRLDDFARVLLYGQDANGNPTGQGGILALEGPDAFGLTERVQRDLDQQLSQYNTSLRGLSRNGRAAAQRYAQSRREALLDQTARFEFQQREAYNAKLRRQAEAAAAAAAETAWATPEAMADAETRIISATTNRAAADAALIPDENERQQFIDNEVAAAVEEFQRTAILRAIGQGKTQIGRQLYDQAVERGTIKLQEDDLLTRTVQYGEQIDVVINGATMIFDQYPDDLAGAIDAARRMSLDGDTEKDLVTEIERRFTTAEAVKRQQLEQDFAAALESAMNGTLREDFNDAQMARFTTEQRAELERRNSAEPVIADNDLYRRLRLMPAEELARYDLMSVAGQLSKTQWETVLADQRDAREEVAGRSDFKWSGSRAENITIDTAITAMGIPGGTGAKAADVDARNDIFLLMEAEKQRRLSAGESWDAQAISRYADFLNEPVVVSEATLFDFQIGPGTAERWKVLTGQASVEFVEGVPSEFVPEIRQLIEAAGEQATPELILQVYRAAQE